MIYNWYSWFFEVSGTGLSLHTRWYSSHCCFILSVLFLNFLLDELDHDLEPVLRGLLIQAFQLLLCLVGFPLLVNIGFPLLLIGQCLVCLPVLKHFQFSLHLEDTTGTWTCEIAHVIVKPLPHALVKYVYNILHTQCHTLSCFLHLNLVASLTEFSSVTLLSVTGSMGNFSQNSLKTAW